VIKRIFVFLILMSLVSCYQPTGFPTQPPLTKEGTITDTLVKVVWITDVSQIPSSACVAKPGTLVEECATWRLVGTTSFCTIYAFKPKDFNDFALLVRLGHEFLHCLDWNHATLEA
jgi:hypothetical protein